MSHVNGEKPGGDFVTFCWVPLVAAIAISVLVNVSASVPGGFSLVWIVGSMIYLGVGIHLAHKHPEHRGRLLVATFIGGFPFIAVAVTLMMIFGGALDIHF